MHLALFLCPAAAAVSCVGHAAEEAPQEGVLVILGTDTLRDDDLARMVPVGLTGDDSIAARRVAINDWLTVRLLESLAADNLPEEDMRRINSLAADYRLGLLVDTYRRRAADTYGGGVPEDSVRAWYDSHRSAMIAERPLVKGVVIRLPSSSPRLDNARLWMRECSEVSIDRIESELMGEAGGYEYFADRWVDVLDLSESVVGLEPGAAVAMQSVPADMELTSGSWTILLHVSDYLAPGNPLPYEYAAPRIAARLDRRTLAQHRRDMTFEQARRRARDGELKIFPEAEEALPFRLVPREGS
ncbi:MAG: hypothetical protein K2O24_09575 [Muribaculaceae bacterium]|nr:hypothetical protein [Muribaculaceae bacterium]